MLKLAICLSQKMTLCGRVVTETTSALQSSVEGVGLLIAEIQHHGACWNYCCFEFQMTLLISMHDSVLNLIQFSSHVGLRPSLISNGGLELYSIFLLE